MSVLTILLLTLMRGPAQDTPVATHQVAERYMYAFTRGDVAGLKKYYNAESLYEDPHAGVSLRGPEKILEHYQARFPFADRQQTIVRRKMERGDLVVFFYEIRVRAKAEAFEPARQKLHFIIPKVALLRIRNGKVIHHLDQTDFKSFDQQLKQYGVQLKK